MSEKQDKSGEKGFLARTATYTSKRARRAQEKVGLGPQNAKLTV